jgi:hypothetical protein
VRRYQLRTGLRSALRMGLLTGVLVAGCASTPNVSIEEHLSHETLQWTSALIDQDYERALAFMTPGYRSSPRASRFRGEFSGSSYWQSAEIKWVKCDEDNTVAGEADDDSAAVIAEPPGNTEMNVAALENADDCTVNAWEDCGQPLVTATSPSSTMSTRSDRCQARLILTVMKPPEMSFAMPIPYEVTWLNINGSWYIYRQ